MMNKDDVCALMRHKKLLRAIGFGQINIVKPTGRFVDVSDGVNPDFIEPRHRFYIEVSEGLFMGKRWVSAAELKVIQQVPA